MQQKFRCFRILRTTEIIAVKLASARMTPSSVEQILVSVLPISALLLKLRDM